MRRCVSSRGEAALHVFCKRFFFVIIILFFIVQSSVVSVYASSATGVKVKYRSQEDIIKYVDEHPTALPGLDAYGDSAGSYFIGYNQAPVFSAPYSPGSISKEEQTCALNTLKIIRYISGLSTSVTLKTSYSEMAQAASMVCYANGKLAHYPETPMGMSDSLAKLGISGAGKCNLTWASWQNNSLRWTLIKAWLADSDENNISALGHRRWLLNPSMGKTGFGAVSQSKGTYNAMYVLDKSNSKSTYCKVPWPAQNTPIEYFDDSSAWSLSVGKKVSASKIKVILKRQSDEKVWKFNNKSADGDFYVSNVACGLKGCIIFRPEGVESYQDGDTYTVSITGDGLKIKYTVNFFHLPRT